MAATKHYSMDDSRKGLELVFSVGEKIPLKGAWLKVIDVRPATVAMMVEGVTGGLQKRADRKRKKKRGQG